MLIQLVDVHNKETGQCNPSAKRLADEDTEKIFAAYPPDRLRGKAAYFAQIEEAVKEGNTPEELRGVSETLCMRVGPRGFDGYFWPHSASKSAKAFSALP